MFRDFNFKPLVAAMIAASLLSACGGGGGGDDDDNVDNPSVEQPGPVTPADPTTPDNPGPTVPDGVDAQRTTMHCFEGANFHCSGETVLLREDGVVLTNSGVQVLARSTSDLLPVNPSATTPTGMELFDRGQADIRVGRGETGLSNAVTLLLDRLGIHWGTESGAERPQIIETFSTRSGRFVLNNNVAERIALPTSDNAGFYDFVTLGTAGTQANYANNVYFPRSDSGTVCSTETLTAGCETIGVQSRFGGWRAGGAAIEPDAFSAKRDHNDGDVHAGDVGGVTGGLVNTGSKGYRSVDGWRYTYANLSTWISQDTIAMAEWTGGSGLAEHNTLRRGLVAFGDVTAPDAVPTSGTATYTGIVYGYYGTGGIVDPEPVYGRATATVDFATRVVSVTFSDVNEYNEDADPVPALAFTSPVTGGEAGTRLANYLTGEINAASLDGRMSARYFGPVISDGTSGPGPAELGGALRLTTGGATLVGGFIARKD